MTDPAAAYPEARVARYVLTLLPDDDYEQSHWSIAVIWSPRRQGWYVCGGVAWGEGDMPTRMTVKGNWTHHRTSYATFPLDEALRLAHDALPDLTCAGMTVPQLLEWRARQGGGDA